MPKAKSNQDFEFSQRLRHLRGGTLHERCGTSRNSKRQPGCYLALENKGTILRRGTFDEIAKVLGVSCSFLQTGMQSDAENHRAVRESRMTVGDLSLEELIWVIEIKGFEVSIRSRG